MVPYGFFFDWEGRLPQGHEVLRFWHQKQFQEHAATDLSLMQSMGVNTVRVYVPLDTDPSVSLQLLDACYQRGIMVIITVALARAELDSGQYLDVVRSYQTPSRRAAVGVGQ